jgi:hypothetical protein
MIYMMRRYLYSFKEKHVPAYNAFNAFTQSTLNAIKSTFADPTFRRSFCLMLLFAGLMLFTHNVMAQSNEPWGGSNDLDVTANNFSSYIYNRARWPVSGVLVLLAIPLWFWVENGRKKAAMVMGACVAWALTPWFIGLARTITGS